MNITLYYAPISCALVPYVTLTETGAPFEVKPINLRSAQQMSPEYLKLNPKHKVPVLVVDGKTLTENIAIQSFIARAFPKAMLLPEDPWQNAQAMSLMSWCSAGIHPHLSRINSPQKFCDVPGTDESVKRLASEEIVKSFKLLDAKLNGHDYFFDQFTAADAYFYWCMRRAQQLGVQLSGFANAQAHFARMESRPSVKKVLAFETSTQAAFAKAA